MSFSWSTSRYVQFQDVNKDLRACLYERRHARDVYRDETFIAFTVYELFVVENLLVLDAILNLLYLRVTCCKKRNVSTILSRARRVEVFMLKPGFRLGDTVRKTSRLHVNSLR